MVFIPGVMGGAQVGLAHLNEYNLDFMILTENAADENHLETYQCALLVYC